MEGYYLASRPIIGITPVVTNQGARHSAIAGETT